MNIEISSKSLCEDVNISLEEIDEKHKQVLLKIFKESRLDLSWIDGISEEQKKFIIEQQFLIEQQQLMAVYPKAERNIIVFCGKPIGRIYLYYGDDTDRILEIGLLEEYRGQGIGGNVVRKVIEEAMEKKKSVSLQVAWFNQSAFRFYEKLGFKVLENKGFAYEMEYVFK